MGHFDTESARSTALLALLEETLALRAAVEERISQQVAQGAYAPLEPWLAAGAEAERQLSGLALAQQQPAPGESADHPPTAPTAEIPDYAGFSGTVDEIRELVNDDRCEEIPRELEKLQAELEAAGRELAQLSELDPEQAQDLSQRIRDLAAQLKGEISQITVGAPEGCLNLVLPNEFETLEENLDEFLNLPPSELLPDDRGDYSPAITPVVPEGEH